MDPWAETANDDVTVGVGPPGEADLLDSDDDWWLVACMDWPRDRWIGYVQGYWKAAAVIVERVVNTGRDQDYLVYPFMMCWRHYIELQLKVLTLLAATYLGKCCDLPRTHKIDHLWRVARPLIDHAYPNSPTTDLDRIEHVLLQLHGFDPTSEHFRYPILKDGSETLTSLGRVHLRRFHLAMEDVAGLLDGAETGIRVTIDERNEYEAAVHGGSDEYFEVPR
jgi:hypothetical protein